ncbi:spindle pole body component 110-like [Nicotiana sylvestris]|uniref:spindle pole body component 110-like n=1 Tax=Nicotiana sylvestris TaxID=4096 RepID=UPI00388CC918
MAYNRGLQLELIENLVLYTVGTYHVSHLHIGSVVSTMGTDIGPDRYTAWFIKNYKNNIVKAAKRNLIPDRKFKRRDAVENMVKQAFAAWGDSSSESEEEPDASDKDEEDDNDEVTFRDVQRNLKSYSSKKLMSLANVLIDTYYSFVNDKDALIIELGDAEQSRDDLMVVVDDLKETIENLSKEKNTLVEKIVATEQERDDMVVSIVDLREQVEEVTREHSLLKKQTKKWMDNTEREEVARKAQLELESELKKIKTSLVTELEKNRQLQEELKRVKNDLDKSLKWTRSSNVITSMNRSNGENRLCIHCGQTGHYKDSCKVKIQSLQKNKVFIEKRSADEEPGTLKRKHGIVKGSSQQWYMDSYSSKLMTRSTNDFLSLKALQGGSVSFENGKKGYILGVGRIGKSLPHSSENEYFMKGLKYSLLGISQICDKGILAI